MSCERCAESAASGAKVCGFCGEPLDKPSVPETPAASLPSPNAAPAQRPGRPSLGRSVLEFVLGFVATWFVMVIGVAMAFAEGSNGTFILGLVAPVVMIWLARSSGARAVAAGGITGFAVAIITFGGCLMLL